MINKDGIILEYCTSCDLFDNCDAEPGDVCPLRKESMTKITLAAAPSSTTPKAVVRRALQQVATHEYSMRLMAQAALSWVQDAIDALGEEGLSDAPVEDVMLLARHEAYLKYVIENMT